MIVNFCFPDDLKLEFKQVFKKKDDLEKENYRPFNVLSLVPKVLSKESLKLKCKKQTLAIFFFFKKKTFAELSLFL